VVLRHTSVLQTVMQSASQLPPLRNNQSPSRKSQYPMATNMYFEHFASFLRVRRQSQRDWSASFSSSNSNPSDNSSIVILALTNTLVVQASIVFTSRMCTQRRFVPSAAIPEFPGEPHCEGGGDEECVVCYTIVRGATRFCSNCRRFQ